MGIRLPFTATSRRRPPTDPATTPGIGITRGRVKYWFGGPDNSTSLGSKEEIWTTLEDVFDAIACDAASAYVVGPCGGWTATLQAGVLIHERTHTYNDTADYFYYHLNGMSNLPYHLWIETPTLR